MTKNVIKNDIDNTLKLPRLKTYLMDCECILSNDIGFYNICNHGCAYCYANANMKLVKKNQKLHYPDSPLLVGNVSDSDVVKRLMNLTILKLHRKRN